MGAPQGKINHAISTLDFNGRKDLGTAVKELWAEADRLRGERNAALKSAEEYAALFRSKEAAERGAEQALQRAREERDRANLRAFSPTGDNHHNAALCPYCSPYELEQSQALQRAVGALETDAALEILCDEFEQTYGDDELAGWHPSVLREFVRTVRDEAVRLLRDAIPTTPRSRRKRRKVRDPITSKEDGRDG